MLVSPIDMFDVFPASSPSDATINDGDEIVSLQSFGNTILQFKKRKLHVINITEDGSESLESTHKYKGISARSGVAMTDYGIVWANKHGAYFYNGETIKDLFRRQGRTVISPSEWQSFATDYLSVGYDPNTNQVYIINSTKQDGSLDSDFYVYNMVSQSWTTINSWDSTMDQKLHSNFMHDKDGKLILAYTNSAVVNFREIDNSDTEDSLGIDYISKDIDFGSPGVRKKIYRIYITYKLASGSVPNIKYRTNGTSSDKALTAVTAFATDSDYQTAVYKPTTRSEANNINSVAIRIYSTSIDKTFEIKDISISYRSKSIL